MFLRKSWIVKRIGGQTPGTRTMEYQKLETIPGLEYFNDCGKL